MTRLTSVQHPVRPVFQTQLPDSTCVIDGKHLGNESCSAYGMAHLIDGATLNMKQPSGCAVRRGTGDTIAGLTIPQVAAVATIQYKVPIKRCVGPDVVPPSYIARQVRAGCPTVIQGDCIAFVGTRWRTTNGAVAHLIEITEVRGGTLDEPAEALIYDSAADGKVHSWGKSYRGPSWMPWWLVKKFMASLRPSGPGTPMIGPKWCYAGIGPDVLPWVRLFPNATRSTPFPDRARPKESGTNVHTKPTIGSPVAYELKKGVLIRGYQIVQGDLFRGDPWWLGNDDGTEWVHRLRLNHYAGGT